jgi:uncharacterized protein YbjQ (UPF0145 family)
MIVTTTPAIEGKKIIAYKGIVFGEVISGVDFVKDFAAGLGHCGGGGITQGARKACTDYSVAVDKHGNEKVSDTKCNEAAAIETLPYI